MGALATVISQLPAYTTGKPRPKLEGDVESRQLRLGRSRAADWWIPGKTLSSRETV